MRTRVRITCALNEYAPYAFIPAGATGTIVKADREEVWVRLDRFHPGLKEWDNCIWFNEDSPPANCCLEVLPDKPKVSAVQLWRWAITGCVLCLVLGDYFAGVANAAETAVLTILNL